MTQPTRRSVGTRIDDLEASGDHRGRRPAGLITILSTPEDVPITPVAPDRGLWRIGGEMRYLLPNAREKLLSDS